MQSLIIEKTESSPKINFDLDTNIHSIEGESYPENSGIFYEPIFNWLNQYLQNLRNDIKAIFNINLIYFNSSSSKVLMDIFDLLEEASENGKNIEINWLYDIEDESSLEYGEEFAEDYNSVVFNLVVKG